MAHYDDEDDDDDERSTMMTIMMMMMRVTTMSATSLNLEQPSVFFFTRFSGKRVECSKSGKEKEVVSQSGVTLIFLWDFVQPVRICQSKVRRLERGGQTQHLGAWPTHPPGQLS